VNAPIRRLPSLTSNDPVLERAVAYAALRLRTYGGPFLDDTIASERARNLVAALADGEEDPEEMGEAVLVAEMGEAVWTTGPLARILGRDVERILRATRLGWDDLALSSLATGHTVTVELMAVSPRAAKAIAASRHPGLRIDAARGVPSAEELRPGVWRVRLRADVSRLVTNEERRAAGDDEPVTCSTWGCGGDVVDAGLCGRCRAR